MDLHYSGIPNLDPYQSEKLDPDPHQSEAPDPHPLESQNTEAVKEGQNGAVEAHPGDAKDFFKWGVEGSQWGCGGYVYFSCRFAALG